jgi:hypothetical protein
VWQLISRRFCATSPKCGAEKAELTKCAMRYWCLVRARARARRVRIEVQKKFWATLVPDEGYRHDKPTRRK